MAVAGCGAQAPGAGAAGGGGTVPSAPPGELVTALPLPACGKPPSPAPGAPPEGAVIPPETTLTAVREQEPITQLNGYVQMTPVQVRQWVEARDDLTIQHSEDEGFESELLVSDGEYNTFIKARAACATASLLAEVIAPADAGAALPSPGGGTPRP